MRFDLQISPRLSRIKLLFFCAFLSASGLFAQTGSINGTVTDKTDGSTMPGVIVLLDSVGRKMAISDFDGRYTLANVPVGTYNLTFKFVGFQTTIISGVNVSAGKTTPVNVSLETISNENKLVVIKSVRTSNTESAVTQEMQNSNSTVSGISGQQISKGQDPNAAEVVKRIPGVTIIENRFIMVRGLNERYNNVWLNDAGAPSAETEKRAFSFDMVPSGVLDRIMIYKTPSAELPGDFAGGMVRIYTKAFPDKPVLNVSMQGLYREGTTFKPFNYTDGSATDKWGFDNGFRSIPDKARDQYISRNATWMTTDFRNDWALHTKNALPDGRFSLMYATPINFGDSSGLLAGNTFCIGYSHSYTNFNTRRQDWDSTAQSADYMDVQSTDVVRLSAVENFSVMNSNGHVKVEYKNLFNQVGKSVSTYRESNFMDGPNEKAYMFGYESRMIYSSQLSGQFKSRKENSVYSCTAGFAYTERNAPDLRRIKYTKQRVDPDSLYIAQIANVVDPVNGGGILHQWLMEQTWSFQQNFLQKFRLLDTTFEFNAGTYGEMKNRLFIARVLGYTIAPSFQAFQLRHLPVDQIFAPENVGGPGLFNIDEITSKSDKYAAQNKLLAGYGMIKAPIGRLTVVAGARYEYNEQSLQGFVNLDSISPKVVTRFLLPSVNMSYNFTPEMLLRGAWGKTLNRPEFREWSPFYFYDFDFRSGTYGSLFPTILAPQGQILDVAKVDNYDLRFEYYPSPTDYIHVGVFYKSFLDPIQQVILNSGGSDSRAFTFTNADYAFVEGIELDLRKNLAFIDSALHSTTFGNFNVVMNFSLMKSRLYIDPSQVVNQASSTQLQGQSPYVINAGLYYQNDSIGLQASVLYNVFGPRLFLVGTLDYANIGELPRNTLDITISKKITPWLSMMVSVQDAFNQPVRFVQDTNRNGKFEREVSETGDQEILSFKRGRYFALGLTFSPSLRQKK